MATAQGRAQERIDSGRSLVDQVRWTFRCGPIISVKWPQGWITLDGTGGSVRVISSDPNDHYRPELERVVGRQGQHWDWRIDPHDVDRLQIAFSRSAAGHASLFALKWS